MVEKNEVVDEGKIFLVWDRDEDPPTGKWTTVLWRNFDKKDQQGIISIPRLVEENAEVLRKRYLAWIYELGEQKIKGKSITDHLVLRPGFSYWWMTLLAEKSTFKTPRIFDAVRFLALENVLLKRKPERIIINSSDKAIIETFQSWCKKTGTVFENESIVGNEKSRLKSLFPFFPYSSLAAFYLFRYLWQHWSLKRVKQKRNSGTAKIAFIDCFIYLKKTAFEHKRFESNYWGDLVKLLEQREIKTNWIHYFAPYNEVKSSKEAAVLIDQFSRNTPQLESHQIIDETLSIPVVWNILKDYCRLALLSIRLRKIRGHFILKGSSFNLWPLYKNDWLQSVRGTTAVLNTIFLNLFEKTLSDLPIQETGVYIQENQSWETALVYAWRKAGHGELIGMPHTTVRFWDFRYFSDPRVYQNKGINSFPRADKVALNGVAAIQKYREGQYPENEMTEVEALRYLYLLESPVTGIVKKPVDVIPTSSALRILVCGDVSSSLTKQMINWLSIANTHLPANTTITIKAHPFCPIDAADYPLLRFNLTDAPLSEAFKKNNIVLTSNCTSAAVDAYCYGLPVVQVLNGESFNVSALRGTKGVIFVTGPEELANAFCHTHKTEAVLREPYFCLDKKLTRWKQMLQISE